MNEIDNLDQDKVMVGVNASEDDFQSTDEEPESDDGCIESDQELVQPESEVTFKRIQQTTPRRRNHELTKEEIRSNPHFRALVSEMVEEKLKDKGKDKGMSRVTPKGAGSNFTTHRIQAN